VNGFSIYHIFRLLVKNLFIIILCAILCGVGAFCYCEFQLQERYAASGSIVVTNGGIFDTNTNTNQQYYPGNRVDGSDISASISLLETVKDILKTDDIYKQLAEKLDNKYSYGYLKGCASITIRSEYSLFIDVRFEMADQNDAPIVTNTFLNLTPDYIKRSIPYSFTTVVATSEYAAKTYPRTTNTTATAMLVGAVLCFAIIYIISLFNTTIQSEEEFKDRYNIPVLGDIPDFAAAQSGKYAKSYYKGGANYGN
jgi:capsular polysaccharide biosynthesis protein